MRVLMLGIMFAVAALMPAAANADDQQIADFIKARLMQEKQQGNLYGFNVDMRVDQGTVWFKGFVSNRPQELMILRTAQLAGHLGVVQVVDDIEVNGADTMAQRQPIQMQQAQAQQMMQRQMQPMQQGQMQPMQMQPGQQMPPQRTAMRTDTYQKPMMPTQQQPTPEMMRGPKMPIPQQQIPRPNGPALRPPTAPYQAPLNRGVPLSENKKPEADENTKRVAYQEPIAAPYRSTPPQIPTGAQQQSLLNSVSARPVSSPLAQPIGQPYAQPYAQPLAAGPPAPTPVAGPPLPFARAAAPQPQGCLDGSCGIGGGIGGGIAAPVPSVGFGGGPGGGISGDSASLPGYAWPSYAAHPNYGAVSYPKQHSASAWPYIGPFYPYPQVPLGWRKVSLEWDDGWWFLDFHDKDR